MGIQFFPSLFGREWVDMCPGKEYKEKSGNECSSVCVRHNIGWIFLWN